MIHSIVGIVKETSVVGGAQGSCEPLRLGLHSNFQYQDIQILIDGRKRYGREERSGNNLNPAARKVRQEGQGNLEAP